MKINKSLLFIVLILAGCQKKTNNNISLSKNHVQEAALEAESGNFQKALAAAEKAYKLNPSPQIAALKATLIYQLKHFDESLALFKKIIEDKNTPDHLKADVKNNYACNMLCLNKKDEARRIWMELTRDKSYLSPEVAWFNLGLLEFSDAMELKQKGEEAKLIQSKMHLGSAIKLFEKAVNIASNYIDAYFYLALSQEQLDMPDEAKENLLIILSKVDNHAPAQQLLKRVDEKIIKNRGVKTVL